MFTSIGFWSLVLNVVVLIVSVSGFVKIMKNDLFHLEKDVKAIQKTLDSMDKKLDNTSERMSMIEGKCLANHG